MKDNFIFVARKNTGDFSTIYRDAAYSIFLMRGSGKIIVDFAEYDFSGPTIFFSSPFQSIQILNDHAGTIEVLSFHGDFYCIEFHKKEVACNGLLFNNIYLFPHFQLGEAVFSEIAGYFSKIGKVDKQEAFSISVLQAYLQLVLAICSKEKNKYLPVETLIRDNLDSFTLFQDLVEKYFLSNKALSFYAAQLHMAPNTLSKKIKSRYHKTPAQMIRERVILEAKKQIHLTRRSIKEIAAALNFTDEFHFSKYFKKYTGVSPTQFRKETGISVVADLYK